MGVTAWRTPAAIVACALALAALPLAGVPAYYESFLYLLFYWSALATSWGILSGYSGYWTFGHGAFFGAGVYTTATLSGRLGIPVLLAIPVAAAIAALLALAIGWVVFRTRLKGELFALITLAAAYILAAIVSNTPIDGGQGVLLSDVPIPRWLGSPNGTVYLLGLGLATVAILLSWGISRSRFGLGLFAIHDDEEVAEVKGVPTLRYKLAAFGISSAIAGAVGAVHAVYVGYVTVGETFSVNVPLYVVLMCILGGTRHWIGPTVGAVLITVSLSLFAAGAQAELGRAAVAFGLIVVILVLPAGIIPNVLRLWRPRPVEFRATPLQLPEPTLAVAPDRPILTCHDVAKAFGGIQALRGVTLDLREGEILGLVGPNGSGKSTLINLISGHYQIDAGSVTMDAGRLGARVAHDVARLGIARTYQIPRPFNQISVLDNVALCAVFGLGARLGEARSEAAGWLGFVGLASKAQLFPPQLNLHERKFLEFARALAARPRVLMLDEVLAGLNPSEVDAALDLVRRIRALGTSIIFVEHLMRAVLDLSDRVAVLDQGAVLAIGPPRETLRDPRVVRAYFGDADAA